MINTKFLEHTGSQLFSLDRNHTNNQKENVDSGSVLYVIHCCFRAHVDSDEIQFICSKK